MSDTEKVASAAMAIKNILIALEFETGRSVDSIELEKVDVSTWDSPPETARHVMITLNAKQVWL